MVRAQVEAAAFAVLIYEPQPSQAWGCIKIIGDFMAAYRVLRCLQVGFQLFPLEDGATAQLRECLWKTIGRRPDLPTLGGLELQAQASFFEYPIV